MIKVGFTGSQGTGKTSLLDAAVNNTYFRRRKFQKTPSTAREALKAGYEINRDADPLSQLITILARINVEEKIKADNWNCISDRTLVDSLAYTAYSYNNIWREPNPYYWKQVEDLVRRHMKTYSLVVYFPVYWPPKADGTRDTDADWQKEIDRWISSFLELYKIPHEVCPNISIEQRVNWLGELLQKKFHLLDATGPRGEKRGDLFVSSGRAHGEDIYMAPVNLNITKNP